MSNKHLKSVVYFFAFSIVILIAIGLTNYAVDPMCYFHCDKIDIKRINQNYYYQSAQMISANPEVEAIILGSSRGERVSADWVGKKLNQRALNLSQGGADTLLKIALTNIAINDMPNLKTVIWLADYFEFLSMSTNEKVKLTPVLYSQIPAEALAVSEFDRATRLLHVLIDHNTFEASLSMPKARLFDKNGSGAHLTAEACSDPQFKGLIADSLMSKQVTNTYPAFSKFLTVEQNEKYLAAFENQILMLKQKGIRVIVNISPYHPDFEKRFASENPNLQLLQSNWVRRMLKLQDQGIEVLDHSKGIPTDDGSPKFWEDGVHPTCYGDVKMLEKIVF